MCGGHLNSFHIRIGIINVLAVFSLAHFQINCCCAVFFLKLESELNQYL